ISGFIPVTINTVPVAPFVTLTSNYDTASSITAGTQIILTATSTEPGTVTWTGGAVDNPGNLITTATPPTTTTYTVTVTGSGAGCVGSAEEKITVVNCKLIIPNAFTPNSDGINDTWVIDLGCFAKISVDVYNRWGSLVYHSDDYALSNPWDGKYHGEEVPDATYYYVVKATSATSNPIKKGSVTIVR
ncbi:MAG TPA: gliding motility-associated C-terminal domain-containing protein, partial [Ferruginibacter sp.]|nr:gliding motility-associated C-terminal domain-containing protein [Ferruginibacter sp.]